MYDNFYPPSYSSQNSSYFAAKQRFYAKTYGIMALGLLITFAVALLVSKFFPQIAYQPFVLILLLLAELAVVWSFSRRILSASYQSVIAMFGIYAVLTGVTMSTIFLYFQLNSIYLCFLTAAAAFGIMAVFGHTTRKDLSPLRGILFGGLIGLILMSVIGIFLRTSTLEIIICCIGIVLFLALTAYDVQKLSKMYDSAAGTSLTDNFAVYGALQLYLDFINLFHYILLLFGGRRRN